MNRFLKSTILSVAVAATTLMALAPAEAGDRWHHRRHYENSDDGELLAAGIIGLAVGAIAVGAMSDQAEYRPRYSEPIYEHPRDPLYRPRPVRPYADPSLVEYEQASLEPWSPEWFRYCDDAFQTFNPDTGTYTGYDGLQHFCVAN